MVEKKGFHIECEIKEYNGKYFVPVDKFKGPVDKILPEITDKYSGTKRKGVVSKVILAFDVAGQEMQDLVENEDFK
jgi:hypothetical protein